MNGQNWFQFEMQMVHTGKHSEADGRWMVFRIDAYRQVGEVKESA